MQGQVSNLPLRQDHRYVSYSGIEPDFVFSSKHRRDTVHPISDISERFERGIREFNAGDFYAAHDTWEDVWMDVRGPERPFFQGMIQVAVGYYHLTCKNYAGAEHLLTRGLRKLAAFTPGHRGLDTAELVRAAEAALAEVLEIRAGWRKTYVSTIAPRIRRA